MFLCPKEYLKGLSNLNEIAILLKAVLRIIKGIRERKN